MKFGVVSKILCKNNAHEQILSTAVYPNCRVLILITELFGSISILHFFKIEATYDNRRIIRPDCNLIKLGKDWPPLKNTLNHFSNRILYSQK